MCGNEADAVPAAAGSNDLLNQVLFSEATPTPKVSVPLPGFTRLSQQHQALLSANGLEHNENQTYHLTAQEAFISSNGEPAADQSTTVAAMSPRAGLVMTVTPPSSEQGKEAGILEEVWKIGVSVLPLFLGTMAASEPEPEPTPEPEAQVTFEIGANGSSASIIGYQVAATAGDQLGGFGINIGCIISNGGASILTTIVKCLPNLSGGLDSFRDALVAALGPAGVDLITKVMQCF